METDILWTDALRRKLHPRRGSGVQVKPRRPAEALARLREHWSTYCRDLWVQSQPERDEETARIFRLACERLDSAAAGPPPDDPETEAAFFSLVSMRPGWASSVEEVIVDSWFASRGPAFAVEALAGSLRIRPVSTKGPERVTAVLIDRSVRQEQTFGRLVLERKPSSAVRPIKTIAEGVLGPWARLRRLLAGAGEAEWAQARDAAARLREEADLVERIALAYLFPDVPEWAEEDARTVFEEGYSGMAAVCLLASVCDGDLLEHLVRLVSNIYQLPGLVANQGGDLVGLSLTMVEGAGSAAVPALINLLEKCGTTPQRRDCAEALALVPDERAIAAMAAHGLLKEAAGAAQRFPRHGILGLAGEAARGSKEGKAVSSVLVRLVLQHPDLARELLPGLPEAVRRLIEPELGRTEMAMDEAPPEALPAVLVQPPWLAQPKTEPVPAKLPKMPAFWQPAAFARPLLRDRRQALPLSAVEHLGTLLVLSRLDDPHAGLAQVREACDPASLGAFAWDLFLAWLDAGGPAREGWAFQSLGFLGGDEQVRRLVPKIREWPVQQAFPRAVAGLDVLRAIGTDVALMHLNGIAQKIKFKALQERAQEKIAELAARPHRRGAGRPSGARPWPGGGRFQGPRFWAAIVPRRFRRAPEALRPQRRGQAPAGPAEAPQGGRRGQGGAGRGDLEGAQEGREGAGHAADPAAGAGPGRAPALGAGGLPSVPGRAPPGGPPGAPPDLGRV